MDNKIYSIIFTESEKISMESICFDIDTWIQNVCHERARIAQEELMKIAINMFIENNIQIPMTKDDIIIEAFKRGWIKTLREKNEEMLKKDKEFLKYTLSLKSIDNPLDSPDNLNM